MSELPGIDMRPLMMKLQLTLEEVTLMSALIDRMPKAIFKEIERMVGPAVVESFIAKLETETDRLEKHMESFNTKQ
jgi:hypothetical protein